MRDQEGDQESDANRLSRARKRAKLKPTPTTLPSPGQPMAVARQFVKERCLHNGALTLRHWRGSWRQWHGSHWREMENDAVRSLLYTFTESAKYINAERQELPWAPTKRKVADLIEALAAITILDPEIDQPTWLDGRTAGTVVAVANGLLEVETRRLLPHSPQFFNETAVPFDYNKDAPKPKQWLKFLDALWPNEPAAIDVLGEWFGYVISGRLGPTRGGKGVIARIETALIGKRNVCGPTLSSLETEFGLAPLLGKSLAIISDARIPERVRLLGGPDVFPIKREPVRRTAAAVQIAGVDEE